MDTSAPSPRVNGELLSRYVGQKVLLVGKQEGMEGLQMRVRCADDRVVTVNLSQTAGGYDTSFVEFEAVVDSADSVRELSHTNFGENFEMSTYNELCKLANGEYQALFC
mmetsp:Transcript_1892/g.6587  ORF Transcript_1892/g.6587 Transcript_1892/m.6587 type:complete len:109 (+) Transcript_1892:45-371(+)